MSFNQPQLRNESGEQTIKRYVHQPLTINHGGINAAIKSNGKIVLSKVDEQKSTKDEVEYDQIEIPASLVFKLALLLKSTRDIQYVSVGDMQNKISVPPSAPAAENL